MSDVSLIRAISGEPLDLLALAASRPERYPGLLCSLGNEAQGAVDVLFACPTGGISQQQGANTRVRGWGSGYRFARGESFLSALDSWWHTEKLPRSNQERLRFEGGWCVYLSYELAGQIEPTLSLTHDARQPVAVALRCPAAVIIDRREGTRAYSITEPGNEALHALIHSDIAALQMQSKTAMHWPEVRLATNAAESFTDAVESALQAIADGEVYQANLSRRWQGDMNRRYSPALFAALQSANPAPFSALLRLPELDVVSSSPERLVSVHQGRVSTRPIAGTRPRGATPEDDQALIKELTEHPKEIAEHVMLIDLERNDLGRICEAGSVHVDEYMTIESYAHVHHIVSNVAGQLCVDTTPGDVIRALFPGGTITGCPKVRCMQLIAELEARTRGAYTGSLGYLNRSGDLDLNILIRTLSLLDGEVRLSAGAGIVADSQPVRELHETEAKAKGMLRALGIKATAAV